MKTSINQEMPSASYEVPAGRSEDKRRDTATNECLFSRKQRRDTATNECLFSRKKRRDTATNECLFSRKQRRTHEVTSAETSRPQDRSHEAIEQKDLITSFKITHLQDIAFSQILKIVNTSQYSSRLLNNLTTTLQLDECSTMNVADKKRQINQILTKLSGILDTLSERETAAIHREITSVCPNVTSLKLLLTTWAKQALQEAQQLENI